MFRRRYNTEIINMLNNEYLEEDIQFEKKEKNIFGLSKGNSYVTKNDKEELEVLRNAALSKQPFWCILYTTTKTSIKVPVRCEMKVSDENNESFKLIFLKHKESSIYPGSFVVNPKMILNIMIMSNKKIQINLNTKEIKI